MRGETQSDNNNGGSYVAKQRIYPSRVSHRVHIKGSVAVETLSSREHFAKCRMSWFAFYRLNVYMYKGIGLRQQ